MFCRKNMTMKNFTIVPNELLDKSQLSISARYLLCVLLKYCGQDETCYPAQKTLAKVLGFSDRYIRSLITELEGADLISKKRTGFNKSNTYTVSKKYRKYGSGHSNNEENSNSGKLGSAFPLHQGSGVPNKSTYRKETSKRGSDKGFQTLKEAMLKIGYRDPNQVLSSKRENET